MMSFDRSFSLGTVSQNVSYEQIRPRAAKIVLLGDAGVGKSSIIAYLKNGYTVDKVKQSATVAVQAVPVGEMSVRVDAGDVKLCMWDTCGQERFRSITGAFFRGADGVVLVYDVTDKDTLKSLFEFKASGSENMLPWLNHCLMQLNTPPETLPVIAVLGNKADSDSSERKVSYVEARELIDNEMKRRGLNYMFYETSALTGHNLNEFSKTFASKFPKATTPSLQGDASMSMTIEHRTETKKDRKSGCC